MPKKSKPTPKLDAAVSNHGSVALIEPLTDDARAWVEENVQTDMWFGAAFACEPRYVNDILSGTADAGLTV